MSTVRNPELSTLSLMGMCLLAVQLAERVLASAVETVLDDPDLKLMEQTEFERKQTLGDFVKKLKRRVKMEPNFKDKIHRFLSLRNTFVHNLSEVPGWDLKTEEGREVATAFLVELGYVSCAITCLFITLFAVSAKDDYGADLYEEAEERERQIVEMLEKNFGTMARKLLAGRYRKPATVHSTRRKLREQQ
jgi:hypothetical protein